jgi:hypothetical protein
MIIEFERHGKTYQHAVETSVPHPPRIEIIFKPCVLKPPFKLELMWLTTDELRGIELYKPIAEVHE